MAGIGFALKKLADSGTLSASVAAFGISAVISVGPWLFTVITVATLYTMTAESVGLETLYEFRIILIYNFAITLAASGPVAMIATRLLADRLYARDARDAPGVLLAALALVFVTQAPIAFALYGWYAELSLAMRVAAIVNYFLVAALWVAAVFLTALKDYGAVTSAFAMGLIVAFMAALALADWGAPGLMFGFSAGLALALFTIVARVFAEYPYTSSGWPALFIYFRKYPDLALSGFIYNLAIWTDKWIMWSSPEAVWPKSGLVSFPAYDGAMFFAQLTMVPAFAIFVMSVETSFYSQYQRFFRVIEQHGAWAHIDAAHRAVQTALANAARRVTILQVCIAAFAILLSPGIANIFGIHGMQMGMFRFGVLGSLFHVLFLFASITLAYFDLRRHVLGVQILFLVLIALCTWAGQQAGFEWYGYGYFLASALSFGVAASLAIYEIRRLPYLTFILNNPALKAVR